MSPARARACFPRPAPTKVCEAVGFARPKVEVMEGTLHVGQHTAWQRQQCLVLHRQQKATAVNGCRVGGDLPAVTALSTR